MVKRVVLSPLAEIVLLEILEYYSYRNKSKTYSHKLYEEIVSLLELLTYFPGMGKSSNIRGTRVLIKGHHKIFYQLKPDEVYIK